MTSNHHDPPIQLHATLVQSRRSLSEAPLETMTLMTMDDLVYTPRNSIGILWPYLVRVRISQFIQVVAG